MFELGKETLKILANFCDINQNILIQPGNELKTISNSGTILAFAEIDETIPNKMAIYDIRAFLTILGLFTNPILDTDTSDKYVLIMEKGNTSSNMKFFYCPEESVKTPKSRLKMPKKDVAIKITKEDLALVMNFADAMKVPDMVISRQDDDNVLLEITNHTGNSFNTYSMSVPGHIPAEDFRFIIKLEFFDVLNQDYDIALSSQKVTEWTSEKVVYWVAADNATTYGE